MIKVAWIDKGGDLKNLVNNFYKKLFELNYNWSEWKPTAVTFTEIANEDFQLMSNQVEDEEIRKVVFDMSPWKAPGPDSFSAVFYQKTWHKRVASNGIWSIGNGATIKPWTDCWLGKGEIIKDMDVIIPFNLLHVQLTEMVDGHGNWDMNKFMSWMPEEYLQRIKVLLPPNPDLGNDEYFPEGVTKTSYSVKGGLLKFRA
ncbi:unnamed protein product [Vicia faba]|uniref:Uncharacterized protein n=1 Tax=Vicia faba TaxID=3906 RepID=A0AAV1A7X0_VICFA|nr:unnamed protein product [Vicia faba]